VNETLSDEQWAAYLQAVVRALQRMAEAQERQAAALEEVARESRRPWWQRWRR
jgi:hypothetical protein